MKLKQILPFARSLLETAITPGDIAVDATLGNGHDSLWLAKLVGESGHVYGFDIQDEAVLNSRARLAEQDLLNRTTLFKKGHEHISQCIPNEHHGKISAAIFNLGYLPGGDKAIVTKPNTTISAIEQLLTMMKREAITVLVIYHGHPEGADERDRLLEFVRSIDQKQAHVLQYGYINQANNPPFIIAIEKR